jgi:hypothetical protein
VSQKKEKQRERHHDVMAATTNHEVIATGNELFATMIL